MAITFEPWVSETGTLTGTDPTYTVPNSATAGSGNQFLRTIAAAFSSATDIVLSIASASPNQAEMSVWSWTPGTGGAAGTITRTQLIKSSTGSAINWSGVACTIECTEPLPTQTSAGATAAGLLAALNGSGQFDSSFVAPAPVLSGVTGLWWPNALGVLDGTYGDNGSYAWQGWQQYIPFWWLGGDPIQAVGINIKTAATTAGTMLVGIMKPTGLGAGTLISNLTSANTIPTGATGFQTATLASPLTLAPGLYWLQAVLASGSNPTVSSIRYVNSIKQTLMGAQANTASNLPGVMLANAGATTLASSFSATATAQDSIPDFQLGT